MKYARVMLLASLLMPTFSAAQAEEYKGDKHFYQPGQGYEQEPEYKFSGLILQMPADGRRLGSWIVDDRRIFVTPMTVIKEELGKAAAGTTVEVRGMLKGISFIAAEIEVKAVKQ